MVQTKIKKYLDLKIEAVRILRDDMRDLVRIDLDRLLEDGIIVLKAPYDASTDQRVAPQDFGFDETLAHNLDVQELDIKLQEVEKWHSTEDTRKAYLAPILPIVQSSGTGKSRVMHTLRNSPRRKSCSRTILLTNEPPSSTGVRQGSFDKIHHVGSMTNEKEKTKQNRKLRELVFQMCEDCMALYMAVDQDNDAPPPSITLFFDEAQHLVPEEGYLIRVLRWITREKDLHTMNGANFRITVWFWQEQTPLLPISSQKQHPRRPLLVIRVTTASTMNLERLLSPRFSCCEQWGACPRE